MKEIFSTIKGFTASILESEKMFQELLTPVTPPQKTVFFLFLYYLY